MASSKTGSKQGYTFPRDSDAQTKSGVLNAVAGATGLPRQHVTKVVAGEMTPGMPMPMVDSPTACSAAATRPAIAFSVAS